MISRILAATALLATASPTAAQTPARHVEAIEKLCLDQARTGAPLADLATAAGAAAVKNPLWPEYKDEGYPEKAFGWSDAPDTYMFMLASKWTNVPAKCTLFVRLKGSEGADLIQKVTDMDKAIDGGVYTQMTIEGQLLMLNDGNKKYRADVSIGENRKFGKFALVSLWASTSYKPPASTEPTPAETQAQQ